MFLDLPEVYSYKKRTSYFSPPGPTIHQACESGDLDRVKELIEAVPELKDKVDERTWSPVHIASAFGHLDVLKWLTITGVNLPQETSTGYTAIHLAAMNGHVNCIMVREAKLLS